ncbi:DM DNA binding domain-containing protein [Ditylenchus destructor]|uniref:DM DNA binding domain-containing protein n=1 Tax=Ditylenchus destructor TaxID=166010 RepID=A0AAD4MIA6_9BILA|nr:DM DNA binding domain-containing protein [Ditylenchus destructor]
MHNVRNLLKGHKQICPFKDCECVNCMTVKRRRAARIQQTQIRRKHGKLTDRKGEKGSRGGKMKERKKVTSQSETNASLQAIPCSRTETELSSDSCVTEGEKANGSELSLFDSIRILANASLGRRSGAPRPTTGLARRLRRIAIFVGANLSNAATFKCATNDIAPSKAEWSGCVSTIRYSRVVPACHAKLALVSTDCRIVSEATISRI